METYQSVSTRPYIMNSSSIDTVLQEINTINARLANIEIRLLPCPNCKMLHHDGCSECSTPESRIEQIISEEVKHLTGG